MSSRTWTDGDGDTWYQVGEDQWSLYEDMINQPPNLGNVAVEQMRDAFPRFPY